MFVTINGKALLSLVPAICIWFLLYTIGMVGDIGEPASTLVIGAVVFVLDLLIMSKGEEDKHGVKSGMVGFFPMWFVGLVTAVASVYMLFGGLFCLVSAGVVVLVIIVLVVAGSMIPTRKPSGEGEKPEDETGRTGETDEKKDLTPREHPYQSEPGVAALTGLPESRREPIRKIRVKKQLSSPSQQGPQPLMVKRCIVCKGRIEIWTAERPQVVVCSQCGRNYKLGR